MTKSIVYSYCEADIFIFIGCATSAPDGSSPQGYSRIFSSIGPKVYSSSFLSSFDMACIKQLLIPFLLDLYISSGARPALPMGVSPKAMVGVLGGDHRLKKFFDFFQMFLLYSFSFTDVSCLPEDK
jgi:hypothetical protein